MILRFDLGELVCGESRTHRTIGEIRSIFSSREGNTMYVIEGNVPGTGYGVYRPDQVTRHKVTPSKIVKLTPIKDD